MNKNKINSITELALTALYFTQWLLNSHHCNVEVEILSS